MVTPHQRRVAVVALVDEFGVAQRRACSVVGQHRSTQRHRVVRSAEEAVLRERIRALAVKYLCYGNRRSHVMLLRDGFQVNRKRVQRSWRLEGFRVQRRVGRKPKVVFSRELFGASSQIMCGLLISSSMKLLTVEW